MIERPVAGQMDFDRDVRRIVIKWSADCDGKSGVTMGNRETLPSGRYARRAGYKCADSDGVLLVRGFFVGGENAIVGVVHFFTPAGRARGEASTTNLMFQRRHWQEAGSARSPSAADQKPTPSPVGGWAIWPARRRWSPK